MKSKTKFIGIGAQKGGVGKSSITTLLAGYLYYTQGYNLGVIDCDYPQHSVLGLRQRDRQELEANPQKMEAATNHFKQLGRKSYPIIAATAETDRTTILTELIENILNHHLQKYKELINKSTAKNIRNQTLTNL